MRSSPSPPASASRPWLPNSGRARAAVDDVAPVAALEVVVVLVAEHDVVAAAAEDLVGARAAADDVVAGLAVDVVVALVAVELVVAGAAEHRVAARAAEEDVVSRRAADDGRRGRLVGPGLGRDPDDGLARVGRVERRALLGVERVAAGAAAHAVGLAVGGAHDVVAAPRR